jgi:hypothetical protein
VEEIDWIGAEDNYARLHAGRNVYEVRETLQVLMEKLDPGEFLRIHRSTIVNVRRIREVQPWFQGSHIIVLQSGENCACRATRKMRLTGSSGNGSDVDAEGRRNFLAAFHPSRIVQPISRGSYKRYRLHSIGSKDGLMR